MITPNHFELDFLSGHEARTVSGVLDAVDAVRATGPSTVLVTSIMTDETPEGSVDVVAVSDEGAWLSRTPLLPITPNGCGDVTAAVFLAHLLRTGSAATALQRVTSTVFGDPGEDHRRRHPRDPAGRRPGPDRRAAGEVRADPAALIARAQRRCVTQNGWGSRPFPDVLGCCNGREQVSPANRGTDPASHGGPSTTTGVVPAPCERRLRVHSVDGHERNHSPGGPRPHQDLRHRSGRSTRPRRCLARARHGHVHRCHGPVRLRQEHAAQLRSRARATHGRHGRGRWRGAHRPPRERDDQAAPRTRRVRVPGVPPGARTSPPSRTSPSRFA